MQDRIKAVTAFYIGAYGLTYGGLFLFRVLSLSGRLAWGGLSFSVLFLLVFFVTELFVGEWRPERLGWRKENFLNSFLWISALLLPLQAGNLWQVHLKGVGSLMARWNIGISPPYPFWLPLAGIAYWSLNGVVSFSFLQAFSFETLRGYPRKYVVPGVALLFILWYGAPLLTGTFRPDDILLLGVVFLLVYYYFRNSLSLVLAYAALFESPILWCFGVAWGQSAFLAVVYARVVWCGLAAFVLTYRRLVRK